MLSPAEYRCSQGCRVSATGRDPLQLLSPSLLGVRGGQITLDRTPTPICPGLAGSSGSGSQHQAGFYHFLGPSEGKNEWAREGVESLQNDYKNKHFIKKLDSQEVAGARGVTGQYC